MTGYEISTIILSAAAFIGATVISWKSFCESRRQYETEHAIELFWFLYKHLDNSEHYRDLFDKQPLKIHIPKKEIGKDLNLVYNKELSGYFCKIANSTLHITYQSVSTTPLLGEGWNMCLYNIPVSSQHLEYLNIWGTWCAAHLW